MSHTVLTPIWSEFQARPENAYSDFFNTGRRLYTDAGCISGIQYQGPGVQETVGLTWNGQYQLTEAGCKASIKVCRKKSRSESNVHNSKRRKGIASPESLVWPSWWGTSCFPDRRTASVAP